MIRTLSVLMLVLVAAGPRTRGMSACPDGRTMAGDLGIGQLLCLGGDCKIYAKSGDRLVHQFATEPRLQAIDPGGPSAGLVKEGDVLVAVDGLFVTTAEGGDRLANLKPRTVVQLHLRRGDRDIRLNVTPREGCGFQSLSVRQGGV
jgi:hypothetical protein